MEIICLLLILNSAKNRLAKFRKFFDMSKKCKSNQTRSGFFPFIISIKHTHLFTRNELIDSQFCGKNQEWLSSELYSLFVERFLWEGSN